jgi:hypothetical protein
VLQYSEHRQGVTDAASTEGLQSDNMDLVVHLQQVLWLCAGGHDHQ